MLAAADALFAVAQEPGNVTMEVIATAAGVGKATLFRAFGSRDGLLDALWTAKIEALRRYVDNGETPWEDKVDPRDRLVAFLDALLTFKLKHRNLIRALEFGIGLLQSVHYRWMHETVRRLLEGSANSAGNAVYDAHALLAAMHIDLIEEMLISGLSIEEIRQAQEVRASEAIDRRPR